jgi:hypothetical protein
MFLGHFAAGLAAKSVAPRVSLGTLFLSAQFLDLLWPTLLALGVERVRIAPGATRVTPLVFEHYPVSHSLLAVLGWAGAFAILYQALRRYPRGALIVGALVVSHWLLDAVVHRPDLPLYPGSNTLVGLGVWSSLPLTLALELALLTVGVWLYVRVTRAVDRIGTWALVALIAALTAIHVANVLSPPPPNVAALAWVGHAQWLLVAWGYWVDRHRSPSTHA